MEALVEDRSPVETQTIAPYEGDILQTDSLKEKADSLLLDLHMRFVVSFLHTKFEGVVVRERQVLHILN